MKLYLFNPDTDMALAHNNENYLAPASVRQMAEDLALLPIWYAQPGSGVLASSAYNADYLRKMQQLFSLPIQLVTEPELSECADVQVFPWGWNLTLRKYLIKAGLSEQKLPAAEHLATYRPLSSRKMAMEVLSVFDWENREGCCGQSYYLPFLLSCKMFVERHKKCVLKAPWSGSGKGLNWCQRTFTKSVEGWCKHIIKEQGFVSGEPLYNKVEDFAMEFYSDGRGKVLFMGYSLFATNKSGAYSGNILMSSPDIEKRLEKYVSPNTIVYIRERLCEMLSEIYGTAYTGYLGVDMMVCLLSDNKYAVHPCVEINMRMNMGVVSHLFRENFMASESIGHFSIEYYSSNAELLERHEQNLESHPLMVANGKLVSGYLPLVPVTTRSHYRAYVFV